MNKILNTSNSLSFHVKVSTYEQSKTVSIQNFFHYVSLCRNVSNESEFFRKMKNVGRHTKQNHRKMSSIAKSVKVRRAMSSKVK